MATRVLLSIDRQHLEDIHDAPRKCQRIPCEVAEDPPDERGEVSSHNAKKQNTDAAGSRVQGEVFGSHAVSAAVSETTPVRPRSLGRRAGLSQPCDAGRSHWLAVALGNVRGDPLVDEVEPFDLRPISGLVRLGYCVSCDGIAQLCDAR